MPHNPDADLTHVIKELVARETENPPGNEAAAATFVRDWLQDHGVDATLIREPYPDRPQVAARVGSGDPTVVLNGHLDVVPAGDRNEWSHPPYEPTIDGTTLFGRGSADMKAGVALAMCATVDWQEAVENGDVSGTVVFHAAIGEETAEPGTKTLLEQGYDGEYGVVLEPTGLRTATSEKGLAWYEITVEGEPAHASRPDHGVNAITHAKPVLEAIEAYDAKLRERSDDLVGQAYATVTQCEAGTKENVVPEQAVLTIDRRFLPMESAADIDAEIDALLDDVERQHDVTTSWRRTRTYESADIPRDSHIAEVFRQHSAAIADVPPEPWGITASTDVRNLVNDAGIEAITWGPGALDQAHTYDEHIDLTDVAAARQVLQASLHDLLGEGT